ncbi:MAG: cytochrome c biogenesis protein CcdA [Myxococcota bacterium]
MFEELHSGQQLLQQALGQQQLIIASLSSFIAGLLSAFSPCVYPLIPITLGVMQGVGVSGNAWRGLRLCLAYVAGMVLLFCVLGIVSASAGMLLGAALQHPWLLCAMAAFFFLMACSLLGAFELSLPIWLSQILSQVGGAGYWGAFLMGLVAGVLAAPCSGPVLAVILSLVAQQADRGVGIVLMSSYALGLGLPFLLLGTFSYAASKLPKSGPWMVCVKHVLAICILCVAIYYLQLGIPLLADELEMIALSNPLPIAAVALMMAALVVWNTTWRRARVALFVRVISATTLAVALWLAGIWAQQLQQRSHTRLQWHTIAQQDAVLQRAQQLLATAQQAKQPVIISFSARWCAACRMFERTTLSNSRVARALQHVMRIKVDLTLDHPDLRRLKQRYDVHAVPTTLLLQPGSNHVLERVSGFMPPGQLLRLLRQFGFDRGLHHHE